MIMVPFYIWYNRQHSSSSRKKERNSGGTSSEMSCQLQQMMWVTKDRIHEVRSKFNWGSKLTDLLYDKKVIKLTIYVLDIGVYHS